MHFILFLKWISVITKKKSKPNFFIMTFSQNDKQDLILEKYSLQVFQITHFSLSLKPESPKTLNYVRDKNNFCPCILN